MYPKTPLIIKESKENATYADIPKADVPNLKLKDFIDSDLIRKKSPSMSWLIPGIGKQGGNLNLSVSIGNQDDSLGIINVSRDVLYYKDSSEDNINSRVKYYHNQIKEILYEK